MEYPPLHVKPRLDVILTEHILISARGSNGVHFRPIDRPARDREPRLQFVRETLEILILLAEDLTRSAPIRRPHLMTAAPRDHRGRRVAPLDHVRHAPLPSGNVDLPLRKPLREAPGLRLELVNVPIQTLADLRPLDEPPEVIPEPTGALIPRIFDRDRFHDSPGIGWNVSTSHAEQ
jgi:hypothetical protein